MAGALGGVQWAWSATSEAAGPAAVAAAAAAAQFGDATMKAGAQAAAATAAGAQTGTEWLASQTTSDGKTGKVGVVESWGMEPRGDETDNYSCDAWGAPSPAAAPTQDYSANQNFDTMEGGGVQFDQAEYSAEGYAQQRYAAQRDFLAQRSNSSNSGVQRTNSYGGLSLYYVEC